MNKRIFLRLVFRHYNRARKAVEEKRLHRALSLVLTQDALDVKRKQYNTTTKSCDCPDHVHRGGLCYHMIAVMLQTRVYEDAQKLWLGDMQ